MNEWMNECVSCSQIKRLRDKGELNDLFTFTTVWNTGETGDIHVKLNLKHLSRLLILVLASFTIKLFTFFLRFRLMRLIQWDVTYASTICCFKSKKRIIPNYILDKILFYITLKN